MRFMDVSSQNRRDGWDSCVWFGDMPSAYPVSWHIGSILHVCVCPIASAPCCRRRIVPPTTSPCVTPLYQEPCQESNAVS